MIGLTVVRHQGVSQALAPRPSWTARRQSTRL